VHTALETGQAADGAGLNAFQIFLTQGEKDIRQRRRMCRAS